MAKKVVAADRSAEQQKFVSDAPISAIAWAIAGLLFLATVLNYMDRQTLSMAAPLIQRELALNNAQFGLPTAANKMRMARINLRIRF